MPDPATSQLSLFAVAAPGLEGVVAAALAGLGIDGTAEPGGVAWTGTRATLYDANLRLRTASRVLVRIASFNARTFFELERHTGRLPWSDWVTPHSAVALRVTCRKSRLYHQGAVGERILAAIAAGVGTVSVATSASDEDDDGAPSTLFVIRILRDHCTISVDASGALLHRRGYRQAVARAPLRETLAAAMLLASGWDPATPLIDPLCGSGTIAIEAALIARHIAPGLAAADRAPRRYAFMDWPDFDAALWQRTIERAAAEALPSAPAPIIACDRDAGAITAARANAERAGVASDIAFAIQPLSSTSRPASSLPDRPGWLVTNPPYGIRVGDTASLRDLYAALGNIARERLPGWTIALLSADPALDAQTGLDFTEQLRTRNGGIPIRFLEARVPSG